MAIDGRIRELDNRRMSLERALEDEMRRPVADTTRVSDLKRQKLRLKEQLAALQRPSL